MNALETISTSAKTVGNNPAVVGSITVVFGWLNLRLDLINPVFAFIGSIVFICWTLFKIKGQLLDNKLKKIELKKNQK